jgi:ferrous iron transport protein A
LYNADRRRYFETAPLINKRAVPRKGLYMRTLQDVKPGETVSVVKLHGQGAVRRRIMDMGITRDAEILVRKVAPLGDPIEVNVRGYELSLRKADIAIIEVR